MVYVLEGSELYRGRAHGKPLTPWRRLCSIAFHAGLVVAALLFLFSPWGLAFFAH